MALPLHGIIAEFEHSQDLLVAAHRARMDGYRKMDAYTPHPIHGLCDAIGFADNRVPWTVFLGGLIGALVGFGLQAWVSLYENPMNVGGRPDLSLPSFVPVTFETTILFASFAAVIGMLGLSGLPRPHHPVFSAPGFERATQDRFFLCIEADDPRFDTVKTSDFLRDLGATRVSEVYNDELGY